MQCIYIVGGLGTTNIAIIISLVFKNRWRYTMRELNSTEVQHVNGATLGLGVSIIGSVISSWGEAWGNMWGGHDSKPQVCNPEPPVCEPKPPVCEPKPPVC